MSKQKLTPWFAGSVKPARVGVYERKETELTEPYSFWDGRFWCCSSASPVGAESYAREYVPSINQDDSWRGLASDPGAKS